MRHQEKIVELLRKKIIELELKKKEISVFDSKLETISPVVQKIDNILNDYKNLLYLTQEDLNILKPFCSDENIKMLLVCKEFIQNANFNFNEKLKEKLNLICMETSEKIDNYKKELLSNSEDIKDINREIEAYLKITRHINNDYDMDTFERIMNLIKESDLLGQEKIDLLIYVANTSIKFLDMDVLNIGIVNEEESEELEITNLEEEDLINLFNKYGYNFDLFKDTAKTKLKKYGKLNNIEDILIEFKNQGIKINKLIVTKSLSIAEIFVYSNATLIKEILDISKEKGITFDQLIKIPSCFISKKRNVVRLGHASGPGPNGDTPIGSQEDFVKNFKLIEEIFSSVYNEEDFSNLFDKCCSIFIKPHNNIKRSIRSFEYYGITPKNYLKTLSSLASYHIVDIIDLCIELNCFDYLKQNLSKVNLMPDDEQFYMIARARQLGYSDYKIFNSRGLRYKELSQDKQIGVNKTNGAIITNKYILDSKLKTLFIHYNDVLFETSKTEDSDFSLIKFYLFSFESGFKFKKFDELYSDPNNNLIYNINGIIISKNKVLRIYNNMLSRNIPDSVELLLFALTYNSIITQQQFDIIFDEINKIYSNKEKKL